MKRMINLFMLLLSLAALSFVSCTKGDEGESSGNSSQTDGNGGGKNSGGNSSSVSIADNIIKYTSSDGTMISVRSDAFGEANIVSHAYTNGSGVIEFDEELDEILSLAFTDSDKLTSVILPSKMTRIDDEAFKGCTNLKSVILTGVIWIESDVFADCVNLVHVSLPDNLKKIGNSAFENCKNLKTVILYDGVQSVGEDAFKGCNGLTIYCMFDSKPDTWHENWNPDGCEVMWLGGAAETWDISATSEDNVTAKLYNDIHNEGMYSLIISGNGKMDEFYYDTIPWLDYKISLIS